MIKYKFFKYEIYSQYYYLNCLNDLNLRYVYELVIDRHLYAYNHKYIVCCHTHDIRESEKRLFWCNNKYELRILMDLNGFKPQDCKIFYNKEQMIEYASILLRKEN